VSRVRRAAFAASVGLLLACSGTEPVAGTLKVNLLDPNNGQDGAVMLVLLFPTPPASVSAGPGLTLWGPVTTSPARLVLTGTTTSGTILTLQVDDINKVGQYHVTLLAVANGTTYQPQPLLLYSVTITQ
jgi:hypothetical protein